MVQIANFLLFLKRAIFERGIPFKVKQQPTKELAEALKELDYMETHPEEYKVYHNIDKMFEDILNEEYITDTKYGVVTSNKFNK